MIFKRLLFITFFVFISLLVPIEAVATDTGFQTTDITHEKLESFMNNIELQLLTEEPSKEAIDCFDVDTKGFIVIGQSRSTVKYLCVYDVDMNFQYAYKFNCHGDYGIEWDDGNITIYFVRSDVVITIQPDGDLVNGYKVLNNRENTDYYYDSMLATTRYENGDKYTLKKNTSFLGDIGSYSRLLKTDSDGNVQILYDASSTLFPRRIVVFVIIIIIVAITIVRLIKNDSKGNTNGTTNL